VPIHKFSVFVVVVVVVVVLLFVTQIHLLGNW
jgi:hypothetical protein